MVSNIHKRDWKRELITDLKNILQDNDVWSKVLTEAIGNPKTNIHLAVFSEPFLSLLLSGTKTIESRFSKNRILPFEKIFTDDIVIVKQTGGPCKGIFVAGKIWFYSHESLNIKNNIKERFSKAIGSIHVEEFWEKRISANYITLIEIDRYIQLPDFKIAKKDRSAWSLIKSYNYQPHNLH